MSKEAKNQHGSKQEESYNLLLVDWERNVVGVENMIAFGLHYYVDTWEDQVSGARFRTITDTLAQCCEKGRVHPSGYKCPGGWNPEGFHGGLAANFSGIGPLGVVEAFLRKRIYYKMSFGKVVEGKEAKYIIKPCPADLIPLRLYEKYQKGNARARVWKNRLGHWEARRLCFAQRNVSRPQYVFFSKGTTRVVPPAGAVARLGGSESPEVIFLDKFARPIQAYEAAGDWNRTHAKEIPIPEKLDYQRLRSLGMSTRDIIFGVRG